MLRANLNPIPPLDEPPNWARLPIRECGEPLVALSEADGVSLRPLYAELGIPGAPTTLSVRAGVRDRLHRAAATLRDAGAGLVLFDGYRPLVVQQFLYDSCTADARKAFPHLTDTGIRDYVGQFVALPSADPLRPPPHRTGGAVDVYPVDLLTGDPLPMGTEPDDAAPESATCWFEEHPADPLTYNRRLLFHAMTGAGFTNYRAEWWHYDFGNQRWANCAGQSEAVYGLPDTTP